MENKDQNWYTYFRPRTFSAVVGQDPVKSALIKIALAPGIACRSIFLKGAYGCGKCVAPDTHVRTDLGIRFAESLPDSAPFTIGCTSDSIVTTAHNDNTEVFVLKTSSGHILRVTANHPILVWNGTTYSFILPPDLKPGDILIQDVSPSHFTFQFDPLSHVLGLLLGNGHLYAGCRYESTDVELVDRMASTFDSLNIRYHRQVLQVPNRLPLYQISVSRDSWFLNFLQQEGLLGVTSRTKVLPITFFTSWNMSQQVSLLQGLIDTAGSVSPDGRLDLILASESVIRGISHVLNALGFYTVLNEKRLNSTTHYQLSVRRTFESRVDLLCTLSYKCARLSMSVDPGQSKAPIFPGMGDVVRKCIADSGLKFTRSQRKSLGLDFTTKGELSYCAALSWQEYLNSIGIKADFVIPDFLPDPLESVSKDTVPYTIDVQCSTVPIFYTDGLVTHNTTLCRIFAAAMNDPDFAKNHDVTPENCADVYAANSQLYLEYDATVAGNIESIRDLSERLAFVPQGRRVVVFDEIHAASKSALNALLKLVEEGVPNTIFVFASTEEILPTIKSRSLCLELTTVPPALMKSRLSFVASEQSLQISPEQLDQICVKSAGHMRDALGLLQLFSMVGDTALSTSYTALGQFFLAALKNQPQSAEAQLSQVVLFPIVDIRASLSLFLKNCFTSDLGLFKQIRLKGLHHRLFEFFFTPVAQSALKDEVGLELLFRDFLTQFCK